ncbi:MULTISPECIES: amino acid ABC transporter permease/ATP-binding protein [unclassified Caballeronia]|uniref:amino acid ABC transporter permease/ATP-binding protein n=1 Tax=unclassified Caballeronia TaxID=2646786 RepID=UPI0020286E05|nr:MULTISPECIES: amino acid ABC transporter permease/ATP-binding protein [unclassified Caballeronia]MDR5769459.1 amino acid ABC transporter permease/ATP-binding protein [Caballeronia sp. LZ028]
MDLFLHYLGLPYLLDGIRFTITVTLLGLAGGLVLGLVLAAMQLSRIGPLAAIARGYTVIFRGTPLILQLVFAYDALPHIGIKLSAIGAAGLALAANEAPFIAEIFRSGVLGVDRGQTLAGQALGMTPSVLMRRIIAPQALRSMIPALGNETVSALKNSSLASVISVGELTLRSTQLASSTFDFFSIFFASGLLYLCLTGAIAAIQLMIERALDLDRASSRGGFWGRRRSTPVSTKPAGPTDLPPVFVPARVTPGDRARRYDALSRNGTAVQINGVHKRYGEQPVLNGFDLDIRSGEVVALLGPSGSGKSTLLRCINHLEQWEQGEIRVGGRRLGFRDDGRRMNPRELAKERASLGVAMVFQQFNLFGHLTARENIALPLVWVHGATLADANRRADALLERVGLAHRADALPRHLSGGQQQRVAIARALAPNPRVLLLDEPTSALDPELAGEVLEVIRRLALDDGLTMIISTHQLRFADEVADRVVFLSGGSVVEDGPAHQVLTRPHHPLTARFLNVMGAGSTLETVH